MKCYQRNTSDNENTIKNYNPKNNLHQKKDIAYQTYSDLLEKML